MYKGDDPSDPSNYRPMSILPVLAKLLEKLVCNRLLNFLDKDYTLYQFQYGFRPKHKTNVAL